MGGRITQKRRQRFHLNSEPKQGEKPPVPAAMMFGCFGWLVISICAHVAVGVTVQRSRASEHLRRLTHSLLSQGGL